MTYQSLGETRGLSLRYDSLRADPRPILHFGYSNTQSNFPDLRLVAELSVSRNGTSFDVPGFTGNDGVLDGGEHIWAVPEDAARADAALQIDLRSQSTGTYDYAA